MWACIRVWVRHAFGVAALALVGLSAAAPPAGVGTGIFVNGAELSGETVRTLQQVYPVPIAPGRYWYDRISGAYGVEGQPIGGQMIAGLALGGALRADASGGTSGVFLNGRQITFGEKAYLEQLCLTPVLPGRYWVLFNGIGGVEGAPPSFYLGQCPGLARQGGGGSGSSSRTYCDGNGNCTTSGVLGTITTGRY